MAALKAQLLSTVIILVAFWKYSVVKMESDAVSSVHTKPFRDDQQSLKVCKLSLRTHILGFVNGSNEGR